MKDTAGKTNSNNTAEEIITAMQMLENPKQKKILMGFFKTSKGQYGEGDEFLGLKVPETRAFVKEYRQLPLSEIQTLLKSKWHEVRLCGFLILVDQYNRRTTSPQDKEKILKLYLHNAQRANNWDLVDLSCYKILGKWLVESDASKEEKLQLMDRLANSDNLWEQRISMVSTMEPLKVHDTSYTIRYAKHHLNHKHDLMHKAVGWLLREMGKRCGMDELRTFLMDNVSAMPRTALRYAIERMDKKEREYWMKK